MVTTLRPYQQDIFNAVAQSIALRKGLTFSVEMARQGGKNEVSAHLEQSVLVTQMSQSRNLIKCSPTFVPQALISMSRLRSRLDEDGLAGQWTSERGYIIGLGRARAIFLSADESSRVVGHTAHLLLEIDESQDVNREKYSKEFKPMASTTNATTVLYGTAWDDSTLLEETKQTNLELERKDGIKRHFGYDWQVVANHNADYLRYVESERDRLGEDHPLFRTQYRLLPVRAGGGFLSAGQRAQMQGDHPRLHCQQAGRIYVAGIDIAGEAEELEENIFTSLKPRQDSTVVTIAELDLSADDLLLPDVGMQQTGGPVLSSLSFPRGVAVGKSTVGSLSGPTGQAIGLSPVCALSPPRERVRACPVLDTGVRGQIRVVEHYSWTGKRHADLYPRLVDLLKRVWHCRKVVVDSTGVGQPVYSFLRQALGSVVSPLDFTAPSKSELGFNLLAAVNSGRLKVYACDGSVESQTFWSEMEKARSYYRPSRTMNFYVDPSQGHDDFLMSLALVVEAADNYQPRTAKGR